MTKFKLKPSYLKLSAIIIICCLGLIAYSNSFQGSFHFDDESSITNNFAIRNIRHLRTIWDYWPSRFITYLSLAFNYQSGGLKVFGYHVFNFSIHLGTSLLVWWLVILTLNTPLIKKERINAFARPIAFFTSAIFLLHPIQTQPVNYITQRATLLAAFFYIASLVFYVLARLRQKGGSDSKLGKIYYLISLSAALLCMFSKEMAISLPLTICLYEFCFLKTKKSLNWKYIIPFLAIILVIPLTMLLTKSVDIRGMHRVSEDLPYISPLNYFLTQLRVMVTYLRLTFLPLNQNLDYDYPISNPLLQIPVILSLLLLVSILILAFKLLNKYKLISFAVFWFFITLLPESSIVPIKDVIFEHRLYLPMAGFSFFLVSVLYYLSKQKIIKSTVILLSLIVVVYSSMTYQRNKVWKDELALWTDTVHKSPQKARPYISRGLAYQRKDNFDQALLDYNKAIEITPDYAKAYNDRGIVYQIKGDIGRAISDYSRAIEIKPSYVEAFANRGNAYQIKGDLSRAFSDYNKAIELNPNDAAAYTNRGIAYKNKGDLNQALSDYTKAIELNPNLAEAYYNRGLVYQIKGELNRAVFDYSLAIEINPNYTESYNNRGNVYQIKGELDRAVFDYSKAIEINPNYAEVYNNRGNTYQKKGDLNQAILDYNKAIEIRPNLAEAYNNRGIAYQSQGNLDQAILDYNKAIELRPDYSEAYTNRSIAYQHKGNTN